MNTAIASTLRPAPMRHTVLTLSALVLLPLATTGCNCGGPPPPTATRLAFVVQPQGTQAGVAFTPAVQVAIQDDSGNTVTTSNSQVTIALGNNPGSATLGGTLTATAVDGLATFGDLNITRAAQGYTLAAASSGLAGATSNAFDIGAGPPATLTFLQAPTDTTSGTTFSPPVAVALVDAFGNQATVASSVTVSIDSGPPGAALGGATTVTSAAGIATFTDLTLDLEGSYALTATSGSLPPLTSTLFKVHPGAPASLSFTVQPSDAVAGAPLSPAVEVVLLDARGNVASNATGTVTIALGTNPGGATLSGTLTADVVAGIAMFFDLSLDKAGLGYTLTASSGTLPQATSSGFAISAGPAAALAFTAQPSSTPSNTAIAPPVQVAIVDAYGNRTSSTATVAVALQSNPSGATLSGTLARAAVAGAASFGDLSLDRTGTGYTLVATSGALAQATSTPFDVTSGPPARLAFSVQPGSTTAGATIAPAVQVHILDAIGNLVTSSSATVSIAIGTNPSGGTLSGVVLVAANAGVATFSSLSIDRAGAGYTLTAASSGLTSATSTSFAITAGAPARLAFSVQPSSTTAGVTISPPVQVSVLDVLGNVVTSSTASVTVALGANPGAGTLAGTLTRTAVAGTATFANLSLDRSGAGYTLDATSAGLTSATSSAFDIAAAAPATLSYTRQPADATAGAAISPAVTVAILDAFGNQTASTATVAVAIGTNPSGGALSGTVSRAAVAGVATFNDLSINRSGTGYTLNATSAGLGSATSTAFNIVPGPAAALSFSAGQQPTNAVAGTAIVPPVRVAVVDSLGNLVTSSTASVTVGIGANPGGGTLSGTLTQAAVAGVATFNDLSIDRSGTGYTLAASSAGLTSATSAAFDIAAAAASRLAFAVQPSNATAGVAIAPAVQVSILDALGNLTSSTATVTMAIGTNPGGGTLSGTLSRAAVAGVATFPDLSINRTGAGYALAASSAGLTSVTSSTFDIAAAAPSRLAFTVQPSNATAGVTIAPAVQVSIQDAFGNLTSSTATVTAAIGANPGGGALSGTLSRAAVAGVAAFGDLSISRTGAGYTLTAASAGLTSATSAAFDILAGPAARLAFGQQPSNAAVDTPINPPVTVLVQDGLGNTVTTSTATVAMAIGTNPGGGTLSGTLSRAAVAGVATFSDLSINATGVGYTLSATSAGLTAATSSTFNISTVMSGLVYTDPPAGGKIRLLRNAASTATTVVLDLVAAIPLNGFQVGFNLPLDTTRVQANATLLTPGTALPAGAPPIAAKAVIPASGPLAGVLASGQSQKAAGAGAVPGNSAVPAGAVFYQLRLDVRAGAPAGVVFDGAALGPLFAGNMRDRAGTDVAVSTDFRIGRLELF